MTSQHSPNNADRSPCAEAKQQPKHYCNRPGTHRQRLDDAVNVADLSMRLVDAIADAINDRRLLIARRIASCFEVFAGVFSRRRQDLSKMQTGRCRLVFVERDKPLNDGEDCQRDGDDGAEGGGEDEPGRRVVFEVGGDCLDCGVGKG